MSEPCPVCHRSRFDRSAAAPIAGAIVALGAFVFGGYWIKSAAYPDVVTVRDVQLEEASRMGIELLARQRLRIEELEALNATQAAEIRRLNDLFGQDAGELDTLRAKHAALEAQYADLWGALRKVQGELEAERKRRR